MRAVHVLPLLTVHVCPAQKLAQLLVNLHVTAIEADPTSDEDEEDTGDVDDALAAEVVATTAETGRCKIRAGRRNVT